MKIAIPMAVALTALAFPASAETGAKDAVKAVVKAVKQGDDLNAAFPGAVSAREAASLRRVSRCSAQNLMKQAEGRYTVVWVCGNGGALGMEVLLTGERVTSVKTMELVSRPTRDR